MKILKKSILKSNLKKYIEENNIGLIVVGSGLSGAVMAERYADEHDTNVLMFEQRSHLAGNIYDEKDEETGIRIQKFGSHLFHTNNDEVWNYVNRFTEFLDYKHKVLAQTTKGDVVTMPFNIQSMGQIFRTTNVQVIREKIANEIDAYFIDRKIGEEINPSNFEEQAIALVGTSIYYELIYGYTKKQWGREPRELPAEIIKRLPIRWNSDTTYFNNAKYQGLPLNGYTNMIENILWKETHANEIFITHQHFHQDLISEIDSSIKIIYTGGLDELLDYKFGELEYRTLRFEERTLNIDTYQGCPVVNHTGLNTSFTRITEHKFYMSESERPKDKTIISIEYSEEHNPANGTIPYYPIGDPKNKAKHSRYVEFLNEKYPNVIPLGRLATYQYIDMDKTIDLALTAYEELFH